MNKLNTEFFNTAAKLSKNPLGIIALFIVFIYAIAALFLGWSSNSLQPYERIIIICFLVIFPLIVLVVFYKLVTNHHTKLYAPQDFQDNEGFFRVLSTQEQKQKLEDEVSEEIDSAINSNVNKSTIVSENLDKISRKETYLLAEELAIRELENEFEHPIQRQVAIGVNSLGIAPIRVDGMLAFKDKSIIIEVKLAKQISMMPIIFRGQLQRIADITKMMKTKTTFFFVLVIPEITEEQKEITFNNLKQETKKYPKLTVKIRIFNLKKLKENYGLI